jgi:hypothetical protein
LSHITLPSIKVNLGKRKERSQMCEVYTPDGRIIDREIPVDRGCMDDPAWGMGFIIDAGNQHMNEQGLWVQSLYEESVLPICSIQKRKEQDGKEDVDEVTELLDSINRETKALEKLKQYSKNASNEKMIKLLWLFGMGTGALLIIYGMNMLRGG